jgi:methylated-DNA-[protein]-cysteine S-methyltransferase
MRLSYFLFPTNLGWMGLVSSLAGLRALSLPQDSPEMALQKLGKHLSSVPAEPSKFGDLPYRLKSYLSGRPMAFPDGLDLADATPFQLAVWQAVRAIPYGETRSYGWCAQQIGRPGASRAVGGALSQNPLPIIIPCHRVTASSGETGGFTGGVSMKLHLLGIEGSKPASKSG